MCLSSRPKQREGSQVPDKTQSLMTFKTLLICLSFSSCFGFVYSDIYRSFAKMIKMQTFIQLL